MLRSAASDTLADSTGELVSGEEAPLFALFFLTDFFTTDEVGDTFCGGVTGTSAVLAAPNRESNPLPNPPFLAIVLLRYLCLHFLFFLRAI